MIANRQEFVKKNSFCCFNFRNSEIGEKLDGKAEIEENIDKNSEAYPSSNRDTYSPRNKGTSWVDWS